MATYPIPIRLTAETHQAVSDLKAKTNQTTSHILRAAVDAGLPIVAARLMPTRRTSAATESAARRATPRKRKEAA
jgi:folate-dependent phosphoribosylglycinamide formyltransferase PurN